MERKQGLWEHEQNRHRVKHPTYKSISSLLRPAHRFLRLIVTFALFVAGASRIGAQNVSGVAVDPQTGVVHSQKLLSGVPLGGVGTGKVEIMTDGSFAHATMMNNGDRPTGSLTGCFAAIWTRTGTQTAARVLGLNSAYGLPTVGRLNYDGLAPQAQLTYPDPALPFSLNLLAFSPLSPFVIKDSCYPAAAFVFRIKNTLPVPLEISIALSWEGLLGVGSDGRGGSFHDRYGVRAVAIPSAEGYFGMRFSNPAVNGLDDAARQRANASGEMVLMAYPARPQTTITTAGWNALAARPGWWEGFSKSGDVSGNVGEGREGQVHPAGVVAVRLTLKPNDYVELPFAVAWYAPHHWLSDGQDVGHFYQNVFDDATQAAQRLLDQWPSLYGLTEEWQERLTFSNLPRWLARRILNATAPLTADSVHTRDGRFTLTPGATALPDSLSTAGAVLNTGAQSNTRQQLAAHALLLSLFPELDARFLMQCAATETAYGTIPPLASYDLPTLLGPPAPDATPPALHATVSAPLTVPFMPANLMAAPIDSNSAYVLEAAQYTLWTGDLRLLKSIFPAVRSALTVLMSSRGGKALPGFAASTPPHPGSLTLYLAALKAGARLGDIMGDTQLSGACREASHGGVAGLEADYWNGECYGASRQEAGAHSVCDADQLFGQWAASQLNPDALLPQIHLNQALRKLQSEASNGERQGTGSQLAWEPLAITLGIAALTLQRPDQAEDAVMLLRRLNDRRNNVARAPWLTPQRLSGSEGAGSDAPTSDLGDAADWNLLYTLEGFDYDAVAGQMTLRPNLPGTWRTYDGPIFAPTFWGRLEYKPTAHGGLLNLSIDRLLAIGSITTSKRTKFVRSELVLRSLKVPGPPPRPDEALSPPRSAYVSVGVLPIGCKTESDAAGNLTLTFDTPLALTAGDRLQVDVH